MVGLIENVVSLDGSNRPLSQITTLEDLIILWENIEPELDVVNRIVHTTSVCLSNGNLADHQILDAMEGIFRNGYFRLGDITVVLDFLYGHLDIRPKVTQDDLRFLTDNWDSCQAWDNLNAIMLETSKFFSKLSPQQIPASGREFFSRKLELLNQIIDSNGKINGKSLYYLLYFLRNLVM
tara:strand:+ start:236 stop:775 length:540 start_codon:yes stop_codon:yes gene_type:complete